MAATAPRAITLGEAHSGSAWLDLTDPNIKKFYIKGCEPLEGDAYDGKPMGLRLFIERLRGKAMMYGWSSDVLMVPDLTAAATPRDILNHYGSVTLEECKYHAQTYYTARDRTAQNAQMMYYCISTSLTNEAMTAVMVHWKKYNIEGYQDGLCFLKILLGKARPDTKATVNMLRTSISKLSSKMVELGGNIVEFNSYVLSIEQSMASYGESADELLLNVIIAYEEVEDVDFVQYVKTKRCMWEEGQTTLDLETLLSNCENKYKIAVQTGVWKAPSKAAEQFTAMTAEWKKNNGNQATNANGNNSGTKKHKLSYAESIKKDVEANPWKILPPGASEPQSKIVKGSLFKWCATHHKWIGHFTSECQGLGVNMRKSNNNINRNVVYDAHNVNDTVSKTSVLTEPTTVTPKVQVNNAMMSLSKGAYGLFQ